MKGISTQIGKGKEHKKDNREKTPHGALLLKQ